VGYDARADYGGKAMELRQRVRRVGIGAIAAAVATAGIAMPLAAARQSHYPQLPSETPARFKPDTQGWDYTRREVMIPMRDGVKLHTVILIPKGAHDAPMLLTRTPYDADKLTSHAYSGHLGPILDGYDNAPDLTVEGGYIRVVQDIRGKYGSEGDYVMNRPVHGPQNPTPVSDATDCQDTVAWLAKHIKQSNGNVGLLGISYDGYEALMGVIDPDSHLKVVVAENPMVDGWMGDDWFHHGAFREQNVPYIYEQEATRKNDAHWWTNYQDDYSMYLEAGTPTGLADEHGMRQLGFWNKIVEHPSYDAFWRQQAVDRILARRPLDVSLMLVAGEWDQEDIYGALAVYRALKSKDPDHHKLFLTLGPWYHGQEIHDGDHLGAIRFDSDTSLYYRRHILAPFLAHYLKDGSPPDHVAPVNAYVAGADRWESFGAWPGCASQCTIRPTPLYVEPDHGLGFDAPPPKQSEAYDQYVSDPAHPVPYRPRPVPTAGSPAWHAWLVTDQRPAEARPDVLTYETPVLTHAVRITGRPLVHLVASTSGTDSDWVVKLIDVYPQQVARRPEMGGYELAVAMDIFRGRYRESYSHPAPLTPDQPLVYRFHLPAADYVFEPGHRIMVQIQSSWFPLYDRNPQTFVKNIFDARPSDFVEATQRVFHTPEHETYVELPLAEPSDPGR
jgi:uncharacterized protein